MSIQFNTPLYPPNKTTYSTKKTCNGQFFPLDTFPYLQKKIALKKRKALGIHTPFDDVEAPSFCFLCLAIAYLSKK